MINYSIGTRLATPGDNTSGYLYYAFPQYTEVMTFQKFCKHISDHGSVYSRADVASVLAQAVDCLREMILNGKKVEFGDLGVFHPQIKSTGEYSADDVDASNIYYVGLRWVPGDEFENMVDDATFQLVTTRSQASAVTAAIKAGETSVDLSSSSDE